MEAPPPYQPKKKSTGLIVGLIIGGVFICCGLPLLGLGGAAFWGFNKLGPVAKCGISIEAMRDAVVAFSDDNGGKLPNAATWQDQVKPYYVKEISKRSVKENPFGVIPAEGEWGCEAEDSVVTGIAYNSELSGKMLADIKDQSEAVVLFETMQRKRNQAEKYDPAKLAKPPKRFPSPSIFLATLRGEIKLVGAGGKQVDVDFKGGKM